MSHHIPGVLSVEGAQGQRLPLVFDSPHSGILYPSDFGHSVDPLRLRLAEDTDIHDLWAGGGLAGGVLLHAHFPRSYIDANRAPDDMDPDQIDGVFAPPLRPSIKSRLGIGLCWTREPPDGGPLYDRKLSVAEIRHRLERYHQPYQSTLRGLLDASVARWGAVWHVNCHSMQDRASAMSTQARGTPRPDFVLGDLDGTACAPALTQSVHDFLSARGYSVAVNDPYKGMELIRANGRPDQGRHSLQIEVNRRLYMTEETRARNEGYPALKACFTALSHHLADFVSHQLERSST